MKKIIGITLIIIGIIASLFFQKYHGDLIPFPILWMCLGILVAVLGFTLLQKGFSLPKKNKVESEIDRLKQEGHKVLVKFEDCNIISNNYHKEVPKGNDYNEQAYNTLFDNKNAVKNVNVLQSRIVYTDKINNYEYVSPLIFKDRITISFILDKYESTNLYIDKNDYKHYYFDLDFFNDYYD